MDNTAKGFAQKIVSELESIKRLINNAALSTPQQEGHRAKHDQNSANQDERKPAQVPNLAKPKTYSSVPGNRRPADQQPNRFPKLAEWKPIIELFGVLVVFAYTGITAFQWGESRNANSIAYDALKQNSFAMERELRPYVVVSKVEFIGDLKEGQKFHGHAEVINSGHTPAVRVEGCADMVLRANTESMTDDFPCPNPNGPYLKIQPTREHSVYSLGPATPPFSLNSPGTTVSPVDQLLPRLAGGGLRIYFYGDVHYQDMVSSNKRHPTQFCGRYNVRTGTFDICEKHNRVD